MKRVFAIAVLVCALTGCGTVQNFERGSLTNATPYGGVEIAAERRKSPSPGGDFMRVDVPPDWLANADVVFSAVGDTLSLPLTIPLHVVREINAHYFPPEKPPANNAWREFWFNDQPKSSPPERVQGGIY